MQSTLRREDLVKRFCPLIFSSFFVLTIALITSYSERIYLVYNTTGSLPRGLYFISKEAQIKRGDIVYFKPPFSIRKLLIERNWLPEKANLMKEVVAIPGDHICIGSTGKLSINFSECRQIILLKTDSKGLRMPHPYVDCGFIPKNKCFVLTDCARGFDSRYFGLIDLSLVIGKATPLFLF
ncbi:putative Plasmid transfer protein TraF [uncultured Desulfobacterium sp.]|uniref:Signal peptidase I n=1 Tax=uncultured Desulfobacterium sp. TaxID=201089 RepID=A0A445MSL1_9BACT|nr:putative Plasmid transfer protein TraF [uncultured Desulfobacterium sp.]